jgi:hypothetical protein
LVKKIAVRIVERAGEDVSSSHTWEDLTIDGRLYFVTTDGNVWGLATPITNQLNLTTGLQEGAFFAVGGGGSPLGPISAETGDELYVTTSAGRLYKITLTGGSLP